MSILLFSDMIVFQHNLLEKSILIKNLWLYSLFFEKGNAMDEKIFIVKEGEEFNSLQYRLQCAWPSKILFSEKTGHLLSNLKNTIQDLKCDALYFKMGNPTDVGYLVEALKSNYEFNLVVVLGKLEEEQIAQIKKASENNLYINKMLHAVEEKQENVKQKFKNILSVDVKTRNEEILKGNIILSDQLGETALILGDLKKMKLRINLRTISFYGFSFYEENFNQVIDFLKVTPNVNSINLKNNNLADDFFKKLNELCRLIKLSSLNLEDNRFTEKALAPLLDVVKSCPFLSWIKFEGNQINTLSEEYSKFVELSHFSDSRAIFLQTATFQKCMISLNPSMEGAFQIIKIKNIRSLDLSFGDNEYFILILEKLMKENYPVTELSLAATKDYVTGIQKLSEVIQHPNCNLAIIDLCAEVSKKQLEDGDVSSLLESIKNSKKIFSFSLSGQKITSAIIASLKDILLSNKVLNELFLANTYIEAETVLKELIDSLNPSEKKKTAKRNKSLVKFSVFLKNGNKYSKSLTDKLSKLKSVNGGHKLNFENAVKKGDLTEVQKFSEESSIYFRDSDNNTLLHMAIKNKRFSVVQFFVVDCQYNLALANKQNQTPLELAEALKKAAGDKADEDLDKIIEVLKNPVPVVVTPQKAQKAVFSLSYPPTTAKKRKAEDENKEDKNAKKQKTVHQEVDDEMGVDVAEEEKSSTSTTTTVTTPQVQRTQTDLESVIAELKQCHPFDRQAILMKIQLLARKNPSLDKNLLHDAVKMGDRRLMKILLSIPQCNPNTPDKDGNTPVDYAVFTHNFPILERLLIDRRLKGETVKKAFEHVKTKNEQNKNVHKTLKNRLKIIVPDPRAGIQWSKRLTLFYGHSSGKSLCINSEKEHSYLAAQNMYTKKLLEANRAPSETPEELDKTLGNPVTASLIFIVSQAAHVPHQSGKKIKIRISLNAKISHHIHADNEDDEEVKETKKNNIKYRAQSAPAEVFEEGTFEERKAYKALTSEEIEEKYVNAIENNDPSFKQLFHHGEQSLLDDLEDEETVRNIVQKLIEHPKFVRKAKIYAVILELHTPRYPCENCEAALLGAQDGDKSKFLGILRETLKSQECVLPVFSPLRMVTQVSTYKEFNSEKVSEDAHDDLLVDIRACENNLILAKDESSFETSALTQYHSNVQNV